MKRLFDADDADPRLGTAAELLRHVPALDDDAFRQGRVRARLSSAPPRRAWPARAALAVVLVLAGGAAAHGIVQARWSSVNRTVPPRSPSSPPAVAPAAVKENPPTASTASTAIEPSPVTAPAALSAVRAHEQRAPAPAPSLSTQAARDAGTELMVAAMQARRSGDLARAARLLAEYRRRFPRGALAEEALVLSVETAMLAGRLTPELARAYLARFPEGRYRSWVEGTLQAPR